MQHPTFWQSSGPACIVLRLLLLGGLTLLQTGCGRETPPSPSADSGSAITPAEPTPAPPIADAPAFDDTAPELPLSPDLQSSTVRVIWSGREGRKDFTGVLLDQATASSLTPLNASERVVMTHSPEPVLYPVRDEEIRQIYIVRNRTGQQGEVFATASRAELISADNDSGIILLSYQDKFPGELDTGRTIKVEPTGNVILAQPNWEASQGQILNFQEPAARSRSFTIEVGNTPFAAMQHFATAASLRDGAFTTKPSARFGTTGAHPQTLAAFSTAGTLSGFASQSAEGKWSFKAASLPPRDERIIAPEIKVVSFKINSPSRARSLNLNCELWLESKLPPGSKVLLMHSLQQGASPAPEAGKPIKNSEPQHSRVPARTLQDEYSIYFRDVPLNEVTTYYVQISALTENKLLLAHSAPVKVVVDTTVSPPGITVTGATRIDDYKKTKEIYAQTASGKGGDTSILHEPVWMKELTTESTIQAVTPVRGGQECLVKEEQAPYWRRFSMQTGEWLGLPPGDPSSCKFTGNAEAFFVFDPATRQVRRYDATTLQLQATSAPLPAYEVIGLAVGAASKDAPVAVVDVHGTLVLDPRILVHVGGYINNERRAHVRKDRNALYCVTSGLGIRLNVYKNSSRDKEHEPGERVFRDSPSGYAPRPGGAGQWGAQEFNDPLGGLGTTFPVTPAPSEAGGREQFTGFFTCPLQALVYTSAELGPDKVNVFLRTVIGGGTFLNFRTPEIIYKDRGPDEGYDGRLFFDSESFSFAIWHAERQISVRKFNQAGMPAPRKAALLNHPELIVRRGTTWKYKPNLWGPPGSKITLEASGLKVDTSPEGEFSAYIPTDFIEPYTRLTIKVHTGGLDTPENVVTYQPYFIMTGAPPLAVAANGKRVILPSRIHVASGDSAIQSLHGIVGNHALISSGKVENYRFISLKTMNDEGGFTTSAGANTFPAGDSVIMYDEVTRSINRISVPDGRTVARFLIPRGFEIARLTVPQAKDAPVAVILKDERPQPSPPVPNTWTTIVTFLNKNSLAPGGWAPFKPTPEDSGHRNGGTPDLLSGLPKNPRYPIPTSHDGRLIIFEMGVLVTSPTLTAGHFAHNEARRFLYGNRIPTVSQKGDRVFTGESLLIGSKKPYSNPNYGSLSPCGNYLATVDMRSHDVRILSSEDASELMKFEHFATSFSTFSSVSGTPFWFVGDGERNIAVHLPKDGTFLQVADFDMLAVHKQLHPGRVLVTSHPNPIVASGRQFSYQIEVTDPQLVKQYRLVSQVPDASLSETGLFTLQTSAGARSAQHDIEVEIDLQDGTTIKHSFPVYIIPTVQATAPSGSTI